MAQSSAAGELIDLETLEKNLEAVQNSFDLSELIAQILIGIAGYSKSLADYLGALAASQQDGKAFLVAVDKLDLVQTPGKSLAVEVESDPFKIVGDAIAAGAQRVSETIETQFKAAATQQKSAITGITEAIHAGGHLVSGTLGMQLQAATAAHSRAAADLREVIRAGAHLVSGTLGMQLRAVTEALHGVSRALRDCATSGPPGPPGPMDETARQDLLERLRSLRDATAEGLAESRRGRFEEATRWPEDESPRHPSGGH